jgi:hypothetical protein
VQRFGAAQYPLGMAFRVFNGFSDKHKTRPGIQSRHRIIFSIMDNKHAPDDFDKTLGEILDPKDPRKPTEETRKSAEHAPPAYSTPAPPEPKKMPPWIERIVRAAAALLAALFLILFIMHIIR